MRIRPDSTAFTLLLSFLVALPSFGIDMSLPALTATGASLGVAPARAGLTMSLFMLGFAIAPLFYGPASDHYGRKPVVLFACTLFIVAGIGCASAQSLPALLGWRVVQGAGAGASLTIGLAVIRDLFEGQAARTKLSYVTTVMMIVPMIAPTAGAALLALGGWRVIHGVLAGVGSILLLAMRLGFTESARLDPANRLRPSVIARNYLRVLSHPLCLGYIFVTAGVGFILLLAMLLGFTGSARLDPANRLRPSVIARNYLRVLSHPLSLGYILVAAAGFGALFAYVSGSSLYLINVVGLTPQRYGLVFAATSFAIMSGALINSRLNLRGVPPGYPIMVGLVLAMASAFLLLAMTLAGWMPLPVVISLMILANLAFGLIAPNAMQGAMQPLPEIAGAAGAATGFIQMTMGGVASALVAAFYDGGSALSMTAVMTACSLLALGAYLLLARPAECVVVSS